MNIEDKNSFYNTIKYKIEIPMLLTSARLGLEKIRNSIKELEKELEKEFKK